MLDEMVDDRVDPCKCECRVNANAFITTCLLFEKFKPNDSSITTTNFHGHFPLTNDCINENDLSVLLLEHPLDCACGHFTHYFDRHPACITHSHAF